MSAAGPGGVDLWAARGRRGGGSEAATDDEEEEEAPDSRFFIFFEFFLGILFSCRRHKRHIAES